MGCSPSVNQKSHINQSDLPQSCSPRKKNKVCDLSMILKNNSENQKISQITDQQDNSPRKQKFYFKNAKQQIVSLEYQSNQLIQNWAKQLEKNQQKNTFTSLNTNSTAPSKDQIPSLILEEQVQKQNQNQQQLRQHNKQQIQVFSSDIQNLDQQINTNQNQIQSKNEINNNDENYNQEITNRNKKCTLGHLDQQFIQYPQQKIQQLIYDLKAILQQNNDDNNEKYAQQNLEEEQRQKSISNFNSPQKQQKEEQQLQLEQKLAEIIDFDQDDIDINRYQKIQQNSINMSQVFKKKSKKQIQSEQKIDDSYEQQNFKKKCKISQFQGYDSYQIQLAFQKAGKKMQKKKYQVQLQFVQDKVSVLRDMVNQGYQIEDISISQQIKNNIKHSYIIKKRKLAKKYLNKMENQE
ncbi:hypothetical protein PPERSA_08645 [Pseudocohnilembus persalinus]|uniref:Uncharacterized protein n=1 Tax=Pseudocohnilembus persalinus TaxID=266149 RepID=A0A0V0Q8R9_PSEPJ|nr:hypothetical protein PPERSA_08645 [Pseudocohnilembus persalinus]|eukprot:KRW98420.1 hypothetical protein PPERSA_08645 [Pseudocohnilembus persalinus]